MKNNLITMLLLSTVLSANAQLHVSTNGQVTVGNGQMNVSLFADSIVKKEILISGNISDTTSNLKILGKDLYGHGGTLSFGERKHVYIEEAYIGASSSNKKGNLVLGGLGGLYYNCGSNKIFSYSPTFIIAGSGAPFDIYAPVSAPQFLTSSDANLKTNIKPLENMGDLLDDITPVSYMLKAKNNSGLIQNEGDAKNIGESSHLHYGFIAQEVKEVYPDLVYENSDGILSIDYTGFIPLLVDALKDMKATIIKQDAEIDMLKNMVKDRPVDLKDVGIVASLSQNKPNPFKVSTLIDCVIPESVSSAFIYVYDLIGTQKLRHAIKERNNVSLTIEGNTLSAGMYIYTLVCDGQEIDSKRMILTD